MEMKTVKIKHPDRPGDYRIINEGDFDPDLYELFDDVAPEPANVPPSTANAELSASGKRRR